MLLYNFTLCKFKNVNNIVVPSAFMWLKTIQMYIIDWHDYSCKLDCYKVGLPYVYLITIST